MYVPPANVGFSVNCLSPGPHQNSEQNEIFRKSSYCAYLPMAEPIRILKVDAKAKMD